MKSAKPNLFVRLYSIVLVLWLSLKRLYCTFVFSVVKYQYLKNKNPTRCHLLFYFTSYRLNMFRASLCISSGVCDYAVELPHWSFRSWFAVCWKLGAVRLKQCPGCRLKRNDQCGNSTAQSQTPDDGHSNARNMLSIRSKIKQKVASSWFLFFSYHNDARSKIHQIPISLVGTLKGKYAL